MIEIVTDSYGRPRPVRRADLWEYAAGATASESSGSSDTTMQSASITLTPSNLTDSITLPAGAVLVEVVVQPVVEVWDGAATLDINGWESLIDVTNLAVTMQGGNFTFNPGSKGVGYFTLLPGSGNVFQRAYPAGGTFTATVSATAPTVGETVITVVYAVPATSGTPTGIQKAKVNVSSAQILDMHNTSIELIASPGAGKFITLVHHVIQFNFVSVAYDYITSPAIRYEYNPSAVPVGPGYMVSMTSAESKIVYSYIDGSYSLPLSIIGDSLVLSTSDGAWIYGDGTLTITVYYTIEDVPA